MSGSLPPFLDPFGVGDIRALFSFVVAYDVPHNDGVVQGIIDGPGFESGTELVDLYEVDATIKSFATREEAEAWLAERRADDFPHAPDDETPVT